MDTENLSITSNKISQRYQLPPHSNRIAEGGLRLQDHNSREFEASEPIVTVITVVFNGGQHLEQAIQSVTAQHYPNLEYILIDGGSSDHSLDIIKRYTNWIDYWVSEPDSGIANAMNKGLQVSTGDYVLFLHADDYFLNERVVENAVSYLDKQCDIAAFNILFEKEGNKIEHRPRQFVFWLNFKTGLLHQGVFCSRPLFEGLGGFDENYRIAMDYEFWLRAYRRGIRPKIFDYTITCMRDTGISSKDDWPSLKQRFLEEQRIHYQHAPNVMMRGIYRVYWSIYLPYRYIRCILTK